MNKVVELEMATRYIKATPSLGKIESETFYWSETDGKYMMCKESIVGLQWKKYLHFADINSFKCLLEEYFNNVVIKHIEEADNKEVAKFIKLSKEEKDIIKTE